MPQYTERQPPENWEYVGTSEYCDGIRYQNECGLWLVIEARKIVTWVGNFHVPVRGTKTVVARFETVEKATRGALEWMKDHPNPWEEDTFDDRSLHTDTVQEANNEESV